MCVDYGKSLDIIYKYNNTSELEFNVSWMGVQVPQQSQKESVLWKY